MIQQQQQEQQQQEHHWRRIVSSVPVDASLGSSIST